MQSDSVKGKRHAHQENLRGCRRNMVILVRLRVGGSAAKEDDDSALPIGSTTHHVLVANHSSEYDFHVLKFTPHNQSISTDQCHIL